LQSSRLGRPTRCVAGRRQRGDDVVAAQHTYARKDAAPQRWRRLVQGQQHKFKRTASSSIRKTHGSCCTRPERTALPRTFPRRSANTRPLMWTGRVDRRMLAVVGGTACSETLSAGCCLPPGTAAVSTRRLLAHPEPERCMCLIHMYVLYVLYYLHLDVDPKNLARVSISQHPTLLTASGRSSRPNRASGPWPPGGSAAPWRSAAPPPTPTRSRSGTCQGTGRAGPIRAS
jgi:hypothetical protein